MENVKIFECEDPRSRYVVTTENDTDYVQRQENYGFGWRNIGPADPWEVGLFEALQNGEIEVDCGLVRFPYGG